MLKKVIVVLAVVALMAVPALIAHNKGYVSGHDAGVANGIEAGKKLGLAIGHAEGYKIAVDQADKWFCVHAETPDDGNQILFCTNLQANRDSMCEMAKQQEVQGLKLHGCPDGAFLPLSP